NWQSGGLQNRRLGVRDPPGLPPAAGRRTTGNGGTNQDRGRGTRRRGRLRRLLLDGRPRARAAPRRAPRGARRGGRDPVVHATGPGVPRLRPRVVGRGEARRLAHAQGNAADHRHRVRLRVPDGVLPVGRGHGAAVGHAEAARAGRLMDMSMRWYVVHAYSGQEKSIQAALIDRIKRSGMQDKFGQVLVPTEEVVEMKSGQKAISERRFFPGYILVQMDMTDETWHLVKSTPKVTGFIGGSAMRPTPISDKEVENILHQVQEGVEKPKPKVLFEVGESVRVTDGPFTDFNGNVEEVNYEKSKIRVSVL